MNILLQKFSLQLNDGVEDKISHDLSNEIGTWKFYFKSWNPSCIRLLLLLLVENILLRECCDFSKFFAVHAWCLCFCFVFGLTWLNLCSNNTTPFTIIHFYIYFFVRIFCKCSLTSINALFFWQWILVGLFMISVQFFITSMLWDYLINSWQYDALLLTSCSSSTSNLEIATCLVCNTSTTNLTSHFIWTYCNLLESIKNVIQSSRVYRTVIIN